MKYLVILLVLLCSNQILGQRNYNYKQGYKFIAKAKENLDGNKLEKAEKFLAKARMSDYGFCGNAWLEAKSEIDLTQARIYNQRKEFDKALSLLDSIVACEFGADCATRDTLIIKTLVLKFGEQKVRNTLEKVTEITVKNDGDSDYACTVKLPELDYIFRFWCGAYINELKDGQRIKKTHQVVLEEFKKHINSLLVQF